MIRRLAKSATCSSKHEKPEKTRESEDESRMHSATVAK